MSVGKSEILSSRRR